MKNNKGITLISLISSIILILILASVTIVASTNAYNQMKFEGAKSELEQMQKKVDEIATDYQTYLKEKSSVTENEYTHFFADRYGNGSTDVDVFDKMLIKNHESEAKTIIDKYSLSSENNQIFYFSKDDLNKYFDLKGIKDVVVNFSTRKIYSVEGIKDPDDKTKIYYTSSEWGSDTSVEKTETESSKPTVVVDGEPTKNIMNDVTTYEVTLRVTGKINKISEVYVGIGDNYSKNEDFKIISSNDTETKIKVTVTGASGTYKFRVVDELNNSYDTEKALS